MVEGPKGVWFRDRELRDWAVRLTGMQCWMPGCEAFRITSQTALKKHVETVHRLRFCEICLKHRVIFPSEQQLFTHKELETHLTTTHPPCLFCKTRHFDLQDLRSHLQSSHFSCSLCDSDFPNFLFYSDYPKLQQHFIKSHYFCQNLVCLQHQFVVFRTFIEFRQHEIDCHVDTSQLTKTQREQLCQIQLQSEKTPLNNTEAVNFEEIFREKEEKKRENRVKNKKNEDWKERLMSEIGEEKAEIVLNTYKSYVSGSTTAVLTVETWLNTIPLSQTSSLIPLLISTIKSQDRKAKITSIFSQYSSISRPIPDNKLKNCTENTGKVMILQEILGEEMRKIAKTVENRPQFYLQVELLLQMAGLVDTLQPEQMLRFAHLLNFRVTQKTKDLLIEMVEKAGIGVDLDPEETYESHFLRQIDPFEVYIVSKYLDFCVAKIKGLPFRSPEIPIMRNFEEETKRREENSEETEKQDKNWVEERKKRVLRGKEEFPSLVSDAPTTTESAWGPTRPVPVPPPESTTDSLPFGYQTETVTRGKGKKKKAFTIIRL